MVIDLEEKRLSNELKYQITPVSMVSGYFDPLQPGHIDYFRFAKKGSYIKSRIVPYVICVIHTPEDIIKKSGFYIYTESELMQILLGFSNYIDEVMVAVDLDGTVVKTIKKVKPDYFIKGPDRNPQNMVQGEIDACFDIGCTVVYQGGKKQNSSSNIKSRIREQLLRYPD